MTDFANPNITEVLTLIKQNHSMVGKGVNHENGYPLN